MKPIIIIMGVSGTGKTTVGKKLAARLGIPFYDADDFHPPENIQKMSAGTPLTDEDRKPWLSKIHTEMASWTKGAVLACSALKEKYRTLLAYDRNVRWVFLKGDASTIMERMKQRDHYMKPAMLQSQLETLEPPGYGLHLFINEVPEALVSKIITTLGL